jgi:hypothetical protein
MISKYKHPVIRPITDNPSQQPKVAVSPVHGVAKKQPCKFCNETRRIVKKVAASFFNRGS